MYYIIFDLEFNQGFEEKGNNKRTINPQCPFEIIQIGALKLDQHLNEIASYSAYVKPQIYHKMHPFVEDITKITWDRLVHAKPFTEVLHEFSLFIGDKENVLCIWGMADLKELYRNIAYYKLKEDKIPLNYINLQYYASKYFHTPKGNNIGLKTAIELLHVPETKNFHDAYYDAYYTSQVFKHLHTHIKMKPKIYNPSLLNKDKKDGHKVKRKIDFYGLLKQFEKMYDRPLTSEEKSMIKLSYKMGLTGQFQKIINEKKKK